VIVSVTWVEWTKPPPDPLIVSRYVPRGLFQLGRIVSVDELVVGFVPNEAVVPVGSPLTVSVTGLVVPTPQPIVTLYRPVENRPTERVAGDAASVKSAATAAALIVNEAVFDTPE
jgi:hypothetical protein